MTNLNFSFFLNSVIFGAGLAADAFTVSVANGLNEPKMKLKTAKWIMVGIVALMVALLLIGYGAGVQAALYAAVGVVAPNAFAVVTISE